MLTDEALRGASLEVQKFLVETVPQEDAPHQFSKAFERRMKKTIRRERMKRWLPSIIFLSVALVIFICCQFAEPNILWEEPLSEADQKHLSVAVREQCGSEGGVYWNGHLEYDNPYYGTINNCTIVRVEYQIDIDILNFGRFEAAGYTFYWVDQPELYAYRDGEVCRLDEAYENGWLTKAQIGKIYEKHEKYISMMPEDYQAYFRAWIEKVEKNDKNG